jgi:L1 cell adhesion molecule like protein
LILLVLHYAAYGLDWPSCFKIILGIATGLHDLHEKNVLYMDLNPENIFVHPDMSTVIHGSQHSVVIDGGYDNITRDGVTGSP